MHYGKRQGKIRVAIVDDDEDMHLLIRDTLSATEDFSYAGGFSDATRALAEIPRLSPDLVLMDIRMSDMDGIECTERLKLMLPRLKVIILT